MGLQERRAVKTFQDEQFPELRDAIDEAAGFDVGVDVDWDAISEMEYLDADAYGEAFTKVYFTPVAEAFAEICIDDIGQEALEASLESVEVTNEEGLWLANSVGFDDGVLTIDHKPDTHVDKVDERTAAIVSTLEEHL